MLAQIREAEAYIQSKTTIKPKYGIVLGTGLGNLIDEINIEISIDYSEIPHFPVSTVESHSGKLIFGDIDGNSVIVMQGRFHYYEGYSMEEVVFPIRVMKFLGIKQLLISNAAGGINPSFQKGDLCVINDHINQFPSNPLIGENLEELGPRFVDMYQPYDKNIIELANQIGKKHNLPIKNGIYVGLPGPMLESPAEYKYLSIIGGDLVGMSTIPEIIAAKHMGLKCFGCSIITDVCYGEIQPVNIQEIISVANSAQPKLTLLFKELIKALES